MSTKPRNVLLCGYKYSGIDWLENILAFLTNQTPGTKPSDLNITSYVNKEPTSLPGDWFSFHNKIVFIVRNPKDVAAAAYSTHMGYNLDVFNGFLENFVSNGSQSLCDLTWFHHTLQWGECLKNLPADRIHVVYFENLVNNLKHELQKLCTLLDLYLDESVIDQCCLSLNIDEIIQADGPSRKRQRTEHFNQTVDRALTYESGTWKRLFTVGQKESFDNYLRTAMCHSTINIQTYL